MTVRSITRSLVVLSPVPQRFVVERFTIALALAVMAVALRALLDPVLGHVAFYATVYMAVAWCAVVCGLLPAVVGSVVGFLGIFYWFVDPRHSLSFVRPPEIHGIIAFFLVCGVLTALGVANRRKQMKLDGTILALTTEATERRRAELELQEAHDQLDQRVRERTEELSLALSRLRNEVEERERAEEQLRHLSQRLMTTQDEERRRIARELHDSAGQTLAAIKMTIASFQFGGAKAAELPRLLNELGMLVNEVLQEIRTASYLLHPPLLDEAGIACAARWYVEGFAKRSGIEVSCEIPETVERPSRLCELVLFRVLQESLTNVHRHSGASSVSILLARENGELKLEVRDNGGGIPEEHLKRAGGHGKEGVGIAGMRERVRELGGKIEIRSDRAGTAVIVNLPAETLSKPAPESFPEASAAAPARLGA
jgi:signal transduction histidine kinase